MLHATPAINYDLHPLLDAPDLLRRFEDATAAWHNGAAAATETPEIYQQLHRANFELWHLEDQARDPNATDAVIATVKRSIDRTNQHRNDLVEQYDVALLQTLQRHGLPREDAPLHSETPGMILDRLSILTLKRVHTQEETERQDASEEHRQRNRQRLRILDAQRDDLSACLSELWQQICNGTRRFVLYRQMKMYNDPTLNPVLYAAETRTPAGDS